MNTNYEIQPDDGVSIVRIHGRFDAKAVEEMKPEVKALSPEAIALDMSDVTFIDSSALGLVVSIFRRTQEAKGNMALFGLKPQVTAIFELTRLHRTFDIFEDQAQAMSALKGSGTHH